VLLQGLTEAILIKRYKRFLADVLMPDGQVITVHCPNPGSMLGISGEGMKVLVARSPNLKRKLPCTMQFVECDDSLVLVESALANKLFLEAFSASLIKPLAHYTEARGEHCFRDSRLDFILSGSSGHCLVEVKSTTYLHEGVALFPDARTERGRKHLGTLGLGLDDGYNAVQFFVVARSDAGLFKPAEAIDQAYATALRLAHARGVQILAYSLAFERLPLEQPHMIDLHVKIDQAIEIDLN